MAEPKRDSGSWILPDQLWDRMEVLLPKYTSSSRGGRPRTNLRAVANGIFMFSALAVSGKQFHASMAQEARYIGTSSNGTLLVCFVGFGRAAYLSMKNSEAFSGIGKVLTER
jgi:hypothetical protein